MSEPKSLGECIQEMLGLTPTPPKPIKRPTPKKKPKGK